MPDFDILQKMDPMARRALASLEAMQAAIQTNDPAMIGKHLEDASNAISHLKNDLALHDSLNKAVQTAPQPHDQFVGVIRQFDNTASDYNGTEGAVAVGVSRMGRASGFFTPHRVV